MFIDKYLPSYHFNEQHSIEINGFVSNIYQKMLQCDFSNSFLIRFLFRLRGMSKDVYSIGDLTKMGFIKLDEEPGREILFGMVTGSPMFNGCHSNVSSKEFLQKVNSKIIKAVINFTVWQKSDYRHIISTETRVWCSTDAIKSNFKFYWFFIKPFSRLIRNSILKELKVQIQQLQN